jgi:hypothetical protein
MWVHPPPSRGVILPRRAAPGKANPVTYGRRGRAKDSTTGPVGRDNPFDRQPVLYLPAWVSVYTSTLAVETLQAVRSV